MNKRLLSIVLAPIIVISLCLIVAHVEAGLIHHHVTVTNTTSDQAQITLKTFDGHTLQAAVAPGAQYQFDTGVKCPRGLSGDMDKWVIGNRVHISNACTDDGRTYGDVSECSLNCKSSTFRLICQPRDNYVGVACYFVKD